MTKIYLKNIKDTKKTELICLNNLSFCKNYYTTQQIKIIYGQNIQSTQCPVRTLS